MCIYVKNISPHKKNRANLDFRDGTHPIVPYHHELIITSKYGIVWYHIFYYHKSGLITLLYISVLLLMGK